MVRSRLTRSSRRRSALALSPVRCAGLAAGLLGSGGLMPGRRGRSPITATAFSSFAAWIAASVPRSGPSTAQRDDACVNLRPWVGARLISRWPRVPGERLARGSLTANAAALRVVTFCRVSQINRRRKTAETQWRRERAEKTQRRDFCSLRPSLRPRRSLLHWITAAVAFTSGGNLLYN